MNDRKAALGMTPSHAEFMIFNPEFIIDISDIL